MAGTKVDVIWSPVHHNKFIVWGQDITLFEIARLKEIEKKTTFMQISPTRGATVVASQSASGVRCVDVSGIAEQPEPLLALGHSNGKVSLATLKQAYDPLGLSGREFVPRYTRPCNSVSWSHVETNLLASALDKHRSDHCILLWDVNKVSVTEDSAAISTSVSASQSAPAPAPAPEPVKPLAEMGLSETCHNVSWSNCSNRTLLASMNLKHIKIFDLRDLSNKAVNTTTSRYLYGVCSDPFSPWQIASRGDNVVCVWDARAFDRPLLTLPQPRAVSKIQWCPTRRNLLMSLQRDSSCIRLHDIQQANGECKPQNDASAVEAELEEQYGRGASAVERDVTPAGGGVGGGGGVAAAAWHPAHPQRLLAFMQNGGAIDHTVAERVTVSWGARRGLAWTAPSAATGLALLPDDAYANIRDISHVIRCRAHTDYGLKPDLWQNADLADDEALSGLWHFLALSKSLVEDGCIRNSPWKHPGVRSVLRSPGEGGYRSEIVPSLLPDLPNRRVTIYRSGERTRALQLCGWGWGWENVGAGVERLEAEGTPCRAAALAAFHLRLRTAVDVLARAHEPQLRVVALALAGLSEERLWLEAACAAAGALPDAYLRALLRFLQASAPAAPAAPAPRPHPDIADVLNETEMRLEDRVAFACIFLSDTKLAEYVRSATDALVEQGDLSGILLTGASPEGIMLLQRWIDNTGDVQTAALVAARCFTPELLADHRVLHWLDSYRSMLDSWQLWWGRCALDTWVRGAVGAGAGAAGGVAAGGGPDGGWAGALAGAGAEHAGCTVSVSCTYCGKGVAAPPPPHRPRAALARLPPPAAKMKQISSCPNCRKPLPRCGVCSLHLGGFGGGGGGGGAGGGAAPFSAWFSWCVACRHAGHANHLLEWFKEHTECPVSSCNCHCSTLDPPDRL